MANDLLKRFSFEITSNDFITAGKSSSYIKSNLKSLGIDSKVIRKIAIVFYEAEINLVIHSLGGKIYCDLYEDKIIIISKDIGPGIDNVELAMTEGYSTATDKVRELGFGAGMGLPNMKKYSDIFKIISDKNGTLIELTIFI
ncbi:ATP-binding protein [Sedimentibacter sp. MB31-C6]|uniref:ATP-binding protein n=1 Tax=Sedimentibacter sp. MB31-C6 TaxID=3109366 RepID=UPI002DDD7C3B|nr:anti-sigma regulatory factor [Sedimentibacter sp. MB36-C1]WSI04375.1 anti-sigma regulatory factor [Sedimentibacter sp. MB36-C1]